MKLFNYNNIIQKIIYTFTLATVLCIVFLNGVAQAQETLVFSTFNSESVSVTATKNILKEAYSKIGINTELKLLPGARALIESNSGNVDGELFRIAGMERKYPSLIMVPVVISYFESYAYSKNKDLKINGWDSLRPYHIGLLKGGKSTEKNTKGMNRLFVNSHKQLFEMLHRDRVDIIIRGLGALKTLNEMDYSDIKIIRPPIHSVKLYHYLHKKHKNLLPKITAVLNEMRDEGLIDKLINNARSEYLIFEKP